MQRRHLWLWACVALLLVGIAIRAHNIKSLPPFNDESHHIRRAEDIYTFTNRDLNLTLGKLLSYYWLGLFGAQRLDAIFIGRTATALFSLLGLAATFTTARLMFGRAAAFIALLLAVFSPFMIFFDRLALADPLMASIGMLLVGASFKLVRGNHKGWWDGWAIVVGLLSGLVVMAKLLGLPMVAVPVVAVMVYGEPRLARFNFEKIRQWLLSLWKSYRPMLITVYSVFGLTMLPFIWHIFDRVVISNTFVPIVNNNLINGAAEEKSPPQVMIDNLAMLWETHWDLHSPILLLTMILAAGVLIWKRKPAALFLLGSLALAWSLSLFVAAELSTRYLTLGVLPTFVVVGGALSMLPRRPLIFAAVGAWIGIFALPFIMNMWNDPVQLDLPERVRWEYFSNFSAGYGLVDAAGDIEKLPRSQPSGRVNVLGLVGSCHQLRLYLDENGPVWLECPFFGWQGEYMDEVAAVIDRRLSEESIVYLLVEPELPFTDLSKLDVRWELVGRYPRPFDGMVVELYRIDED